MADSVLLFSATPVPVIGAMPQRPRRPHDVVVYATRNGELHLLDGGKLMRWRDQMFSQYATRFEIDMGDHQRTVRLGQSPPSSAEGVYRFDVTLDVGFRVHNPVEVVRRNVRDALPILYAHLIQTCHQIAGQYSIEQPAQAEAALNRHFLQQEVVEGCLLLYKCRARVAPEQAYYRHHRDRAEARMTIGDRQAENELATVETGHQINLDLLRQQGRLLMAQNERAALAGRPLDARELIAIAMERGELPYEVGIARMMELETLQAAGDRAVQDRYDARVKTLADNKLLGKGDAAGLLSPPEPQLESAARTMPPAQAAQPAWDDPLPGTTPAPRALIPIYMVLDQSMALNGAARALTTGVQALLDALAGHPDIASAVRLSVLGYAEEVNAALAMTAVRTGLRLPPLTPSGGARYTAVFERLLECVPRDAAMLKAQSTAVCRPQVVFLGSARPDDEPAWTDPHARLIDRGRHPTAPDIIACGVGEVSPFTIAGVATRPELAFVADPGDVGIAVERFCAFARQHILGYGRAILDGAAGPVVSPPDGFRPARELV